MNKTTQKKKSSASTVRPDTQKREQEKEAYACNVNLHLTELFIPS